MRCCSIGCTPSRSSLKRRRLAHNEPHRERAHGPRARRGCSIATLSGGVRASAWRWLARWCRTPELLLLDEPTNHLDLDTIDWLEDFLADFAGTIVTVTHDRRFLDRVATRIVELDRGRLVHFRRRLLRLPDGEGEAACRRGACIAISSTRCSRRKRHGSARASKRAEPGTRGACGGWSSCGASVRHDGSESAV